MFLEETRLYPFLRTSEVESMKYLRPLVVFLTAILVSSSSAAAVSPYSGILAQPGRIIETDAEKRLGTELHNYYRDLGMKLVSDPKCSAVWNRLAPIFRKSFTRTDFDLYVFDRPDPDVFSVPGHIYVSTGAAASLTEAELAHVISHEFMHMIDSSILKSWQADLDKGGTLSKLSADIQGIAAMFRGSKDYILPYHMSLEDTALNFSLEMAAEAGYPVKSMADAWEKLRKVRTVEFEDYLNLHSLEGPMWTIMSSRIKALAYSEWQTNTSETGMIPSAWSLDLLKLGDGTAQYERRLGAISPGTAFAVDSTGGQIAFLSDNSQYWKIVGKNGDILRTLDDRDNMSIQYYNMEFSPNGDSIILNTQEDIIRYTAKVRGSTWLGLGSISKVSGSGSVIAYSDYGDIIVKEIETGRVVSRGDFIVQGSVKAIVWSPDDRSLLLRSDADGKTGLTVFDLDTERKTSITLNASVIGQPIWTSKGIGTLLYDNSRLSLVMLNYDHTAGTLNQTFSKVLSMGNDVQGPFITDLKDTERGIFAAVAFSQRSVPRLFVGNLSSGQSVTYRLPDQSIKRVNQVRWLSAPDLLVISSSTL